MEFSVIINILLTCAVIYISRETAEANKKSAEAAEESAALTKRSLEFNMQIFEHQNKKDERFRIHYRKMFSTQIIEYSIQCFDVLIKLYKDGEKATVQEIQALSQFESSPVFEREKMIPYFEYEEIEPIFKVVNSIKDLQADITIFNGSIVYDESFPPQEGRSLLNQLQIITKHFSA